MGGFMGYVNFGTAGFFAVGAYSSVVLYNLVKVRIPVKVISDSGLNVISDSGQSDHRSERSDAGVGL